MGYILICKCFDVLDFAYSRCGIGACVLFLQVRCVEDPSMVNIMKVMQS